MSGKKPRVAWFSQLNVAARSGASAHSESSAAYASDVLLPILAEHLEIDLFHDRVEPYRDFRTYHYLSCFQRHRKQPYDIFFYQVEDLKCSNFVRMHLGLMPGIVWFHDFLFTTFAPEALAYSPWTKIPSAFERRSERYELERVVLEQKKRTGPPPTRPDEPCALRESTLSALSLFSDERSHQEFLSRKVRSLGAGLKEIEPKSLFLPFPVEKRSRPEVYEPGLIAYAGSVHVEHRPHKVLEALSKLGRAYKLVWLIDKHEERQARELLNEFSIRNCSLEFSRSPSRWTDIVANAQIALHPLFSVFGRQGPYLQISMMAGVPCIVSDFGSSLYLPSELIAKVEPGFSEACQLRAVMEKLLTCDASRLREELQAYAVENFESELVSRELMQVFDACAVPAREFTQRWDKFLHLAAIETVSEIKNSCVAEEDSWAKVYLESFKELGWS